MNKFLDKLEKSGYPSYIVGGYLRDRLLGKKSSDLDIATLARPNQIEEVFKDYKTIGIGKKFGTIKVIMAKDEAEITSFRKDIDYKDKRRPDRVLFANSIKEDLARRDFTINAMALRNSKLIDPFGGVDDLKGKTIRAVGDPYERIGEDYLRALRAIRFAVSLDFKIDNELKKAIKAKSSNINYLSKERIRDELSKIMISKDPARGIRLLDRLGLLDKILPEVSQMKGFDQHSPYHSLDVYDHSLMVLANTEADLSLRLAGLFHDTGKVDTFFLDSEGKGRFFGHQKISKDKAVKRLKSLKFSKNTIEEVGILVERHMDSANTYTKKSVAKLFRKFGEKRLKKLFSLQEADKLATNSKDLSNIKRGRKILYDLLEREPIKDRKDLAIDGNDLIDLGLSQGKIIGKILKTVEEEVFYERLRNKKDDIIDFLRASGYFLDRKGQK